MVETVNTKTGSEGRSREGLRSRNTGTMMMYCVYVYRVPLCSFISASSTVVTDTSLDHDLLDMFH